MADQELAPGDVVYLKSGSPAMTLARLEEGRAICAWFTGKMTASNAYPLDCLTKNKPADDRAGRCVPGR